MKNKELAGRKSVKGTGIYFICLGAFCLMYMMWQFPFMIQELTESSVGFFDCLLAGPHDSKLWTEIYYLGYTIGFGLHGFCCVMFADRFDKPATCLITFFVSMIFFAGMYYMETISVYSAPFEVYKSEIIIAIIFLGIPWLINLVGIIKNMMLLYRESR